MELTVKRNNLNELMSGKIGEVLLWCAILVLLTINNARFSIAISIELALYSLLSMLLVSLVTRFLLIPRFLSKSRTRIFALFTIAFLIIITIISSKIDFMIVRNYLPPLHSTYPQPLHGKREFFEFMPYIKAGILNIGAFLISVMFYLVSKSKKDKQLAMQLQSEKASLELKFLKSQINPHFLFNALNNIYSLIYMGDSNAATSVLKLSELLRYVTDDCQAEVIALDREVHHLENYIEFQQLRVEQQMDVTFVKEITNSRIVVSPMLFQPFVENCFKHSKIEINRDAFIRISILQDVNRILFCTENSIGEQISPTTEDSSRLGIGISNVRKRLELLYPHRFELVTENLPNRFLLRLEIKLS